MEAEAILKMDIFFFVTTVVVVGCGLLLIPLLYYLVKAARNIRDITETVKKEAQDIAEDVREVRKDVKDGIKTAKRYTKAAAGANVIRSIANTVDLFGSSTSETKENTPKKKRIVRRTRTKKREE